MKKQIVWLIVGCLMVAALTLGSCAPAAEEPVLTPEEEKVKVTLTKRDGTKVEKMVEKPKYGGVFTPAFHERVVGFDDAVSVPWKLWTTRPVTEKLVMGDWARGPAGTGEGSLLIRGQWFPEISTGSLAESWELRQPDTIIYKIRKGVHWQDKEPVNGRELDANDVAFTINRIFTTPTSFLCTSYADRFGSAEATDRWTVVVKVKGILGIMYYRISNCMQIVAPEVIEKYGAMKTYDQVVGTGAFWIADHVPGSYLTLERNPNYWKKDPLFPENQLPYLDGVKWLIILDASTRIAALRTGRVDWVQTVGWEDAETLMKTNPELKWNKWLQAAHQNVLFLRTDVKPFDDIRVRRALAMAFNMQAVKDEFYGGNAELLSCPVAPYAEFMDVFIPLEEYPEIVQKCYGYHPEEAKKLLAEAGYPEGFKTSILCHPGQADLLSIVKDDWAKIGVDLELDVKEFSVYMSTKTAHGYKAMVIADQGTVNPYVMHYWDAGAPENYSIVDDPTVNAATEIIWENQNINMPKLKEAYRGVIPYIHEQCWQIETPSPYLWTMWQPWVKGYHGETAVGVHGYYLFTPYIWYDQELKEQMTGRS